MNGDSILPIYTIIVRERVIAAKYEFHREFLAELTPMRRNVIGFFFTRCCQWQRRNRWDEIKSGLGRSLGSIETGLPRPFIIIDKGGAPTFPVEIENENTRLHPFRSLCSRTIYQSMRSSLSCCICRFRFVHLYPLLLVFLEQLFQGVVHHASTLKDDSRRRFVSRIDLTRDGKN